jgi:hypothetical protein
MQSIKIDSYILSTNTKCHHINTNCQTHLLSLHLIASVTESFSSPALSILSITLYFIPVLFSFISKLFSFGLSVTGNILGSALGIFGSTLYRIASLVELVLGIITEARSTFLGFFNASFDKITCIIKAVFSLGLIVSSILLSS